LTRRHAQDLSLELKVVPWMARAEHRSSVRRSWWFSDGEGCGNVPQTSTRRSYSWKVDDSFEAITFGLGVVRDR